MAAQVDALLPREQFVQQGVSIPLTIRASRLRMVQPAHGPAVYATHLANMGEAHEAEFSPVPVPVGAAAAVPVLPVGLSMYARTLFQLKRMVRMGAMRANATRNFFARLPGPLAAQGNQVAVVFVLNEAACGLRNVGDALVPNNTPPGSQDALTILRHRCRTRFQAVCQRLDGEIRHPSQVSTAANFLKNAQDNQRLCLLFPTADQVPVVGFENPLAEFWNANPNPGLDEYERFGNGHVQLVCAEEMKAASNGYNENFYKMASEEPEAKNNRKLQHWEKRFFSKWLGESVVTQKAAVSAVSEPAKKIYEKLVEECVYAVTCIEDIYVHFRDELNYEDAHFSPLDHAPAIVQARLAHMAGRLLDYVMSLENFYSGLLAPGAAPCIFILQPKSSYHFASCPIHTRTIH